MEIFVIWFSYSFVAGTALPFMFFPGLHAWEPVKNIIPFLSFGPLSLRGLLWVICGFFLVAALLNLLARRKISAAILACLASFVAGTANYYRVVDITSPSHITNFYDTSFFDKTIIRGTIVADPDQRDGFTNIDIEPQVIIPDPESQPSNVIKLEGKTGYIRAKIYPSVGDYYYALSYGDFVEINSSINEPMKLTNPAGFDYAAYLRARNIYASTRPLRNPDEIKYLGSGKIPWIWRVSLTLKKKILLTIRKTMRYPESAFLGGVTLGLRGGVPQKVKSEFQATGVAHVLAVSGLHVGFVAVLLMMIGRVFRLPSRVSFVFVVFGLIIFTLITGASPATRRAAIMFSMMDFFRSVMRMSLGHSTVLTIPLTAFIILLFDPLKLPDGSFVLSFMAVWSLAMISGPVENVFKILGRGWLFAATLFAILASTMLVVVAPALYQDRTFTAGYLALLALLFILAWRIERKRPLTSLNIEYMPKWFTSFFYAQFAIQIGMMFPLSAVYFQRFPIAGMYANFIAIPLISFIVQYGLLAGLFNMILTAVGLPSLGIKIALLINAFNWILCRIFLGMATFFARLFPYPYVAVPSPLKITLYYVGVLIFIFWKPLTFQLRLFIMRLRDVFEERELIKRAIPAAAGALVLLAVGVAALSALKKDTMRVTFPDVSFGNSVLVESPDGKTILIDAGQGGSRDSGSNVLAPLLSKYNISRIDYLLFTSLKSNTIGGAPYLLEHWKVDKILLPYDPARIPYGSSYYDFLSAVGDYNLASNPRSPSAASLYISWYELVKTFKQKDIPHEGIHAGDVIYSVKKGGKEFRAEVLASPLDSAAQESGVCVKVSYGKNSILIIPQSGRDAQWEVVDHGTSTLRSDIILLPKNGNPGAVTDEILAAAGYPRYAVIQYGYVPKALRPADYFYDSDLQRTVDKLNAAGIPEVYRTDKDGAVIAVSDGENLEVRTVLKRRSGEK